MAVHRKVFPVVTLAFRSDPDTGDLIAAVSSVVIFTVAQEVIATSRLDLHQPMQKDVNEN